MALSRLGILSWALMGIGHAITFQRLESIPGESPYSEAWGVSGDGSTVVGSATYTSDNYVRPVRWNQGGIDAFPLVTNPAPGASLLGQGLGVSRDGSVVVGSFAGQGFRWTSADGMVPLGSLSQSAPYSTAFGVSGNGDTVFGITNDAIGSVAFQWTAAGGMTSLGRLSGPAAGGTYAYAGNEDGSLIVGSAEGAPSTRAVVWDHGAMQPLPLPPGTILRSEADDISGRFVLGSVTYDGTWPYQSQVIVWDLHGEFLPRLLAGLDGASQTFAGAISSNGAVVGGQAILGNEAVAVVWDMAGNLHRLDALLAARGLDVEGWQFAGVTGISDDGLTLVGNAMDPQGHQQGWILRDFSFVPEPGSTLLVMSGAGALFCLNRRRLHDRSIQSSIISRFRSGKSPIPSG